MKRFIYCIYIILKQTLKDLRYNYKHVMSHAKETSEIKYSMLRVYCHMLDKGMNNIHFERGHSLGFYKKAVQLRDELIPIYGNDNCFLWVKDIINRFEKAQENGKPELENVVPSNAYSEEKISEYRQILLNRTSCRNFIPKKIPSYVLEEIVKIAIDAPNGCCRQVVRYYVSQNEKVVNSAIPHIAGITNFSNVQCLVCVAAEFNYYDIIDKNLQYVDAALSAENFIIGATLYGVYGTMCNFFQATPKDVEICKQLFNVADTENIVLFIAIGYPISIPQKPARRSLDTFFKEI